MTRIPFEEALTSPEPFVLAWRLTAPEPGQRTLSVFSLAGGGAEQVAWQRYADAELEAVTARMRADGMRVGHYSDGSDHVWVADDQGLTVWDDKGLGLFTDGDVLQAADGSRYGREALAQVILFAEEDHLGRGLKARLGDGRVVELMAEQRWTALSQPHYSRDDLVFETEWCLEVGKAITSWAGCGYDDQI